MGYILNHTLAADSLALAELPLCELRLMNNQHVLWLVLIPRRDHVTELLDLAAADQAVLLAEINQVSALLKQHFPCDKLNIALLGNVVPQLHVHIIARRFDDAYFPRAPFGLPGQPYAAEAGQQLIQTLQALL